MAKYEKRHTRVKLVQYSSRISRQPAERERDGVREREREREK